MARKIDFEADVISSDGTVSEPYTSRITIDNTPAKIADWIRNGCTELGVSETAVLTMLLRFRSFIIANPDETKLIRFTLTATKE